MRYEDIEIHSVAELISALKEQTKSNEIIWFRGQAHSIWPLVPSLARNPDNLKAESALLKRFIQNAVPHLTEKVPNDDWEWICLMQHHRAPTRLLDWTESPLVALFFAVVDESAAHNNVDGALWCLDPISLNKEARLRFAHELELPAFGRDEEINAYLPDRLNNGIADLNPIAVIAPRSSRRMAAQLGTFTITHRTHTPIEEVGENRHAWRLIIPAAAKPNITEEIFYLRYSELTLFPDLDRVAKLTMELIK